MKKYLRLLFVFSLVFLLIPVSCKKDPEGPTDIRIRNKTTSVFRNVVVNTSGGEYNYGEINAGTTTSYHRFDIAYRQALITLDINEVQYMLIPDDTTYTYEVPLGKGKFTYELSIADTASRTLAVHVIAEAPL